MQNQITVRLTLASAILLTLGPVAAAQVVEPVSRTTGEIEIQRAAVTGAGGGQVSVVCKSEDIEPALYLMATRLGEYFAPGQEWEQCGIHGGADSGYWVLGADRFEEGKCSGGFVWPPPPDPDDPGWARCEIGPDGGAQDLVRGILALNVKHRREMMELYANGWSRDLQEMKNEMRREACPSLSDWDSCERRLNTLRFRVIRIGR